MHLHYWVFNRRRPSPFVISYFANPPCKRNKRLLRSTDLYTIWLRFRFS
ncbi:MAG: hypothetical protein ACTS46_00715 [Candidatus Hodgkinia cicadicola]